jgi:predicted ABC-type ATPase
VANVYVIGRVQERVSNGGHNIPEDVIERRYSRGVTNLTEFVKVSDKWIICDNSYDTVAIVAEGILSLDPKIYNLDIWKKLGVEL